MARILLGVTGSVAATKTTLLYQMLLESGHNIRVLATDRSLHFFNPKHLNHADNPVIYKEIFFTDEDEWNGRGPNNKYQRGDIVLHIDLSRWAEVLLVAPLDANSLSKFAMGLTEGCLCSVWRAWDWTKPVILAPAMNTIMWDHPVTRRHIYTISEDSGLFSNISSFHNNAQDLIDEINSKGKHFVILPPITKKLACGDEGMGAMAEITAIIEQVNKLSLSKGL